MTDADVLVLTTRLLWLAFALGVAFGAVAQRTHFCAMGAVADIVHSGDWTRMRMWALAAGSAILGFNAMVALGWVRAADTIYASPTLAWASHGIGGLMFGFGMVLASGCGSKSLVRVGGGNLKSLAVLLVLGVTALTTLKGLSAVWRVASVDTLRLTLPAAQDLPSLAAALGGSVAQRALAFGLALGGALVAWALMRREGRQPVTLLGGLGIGALVVALWWVSGRPGHLAEDPQTLEEVFLATNSRRMESFSFVAPVAYLLDWLMYFSDRSQHLTQGIVAVLGVIAGSAAAALAQRSFRWEGFGGVEDTANHLVGAVLMGVGGITALGCTIGQGLSGLSTLSLGSVIALAAILAGAVLGLRWQIWRVARQA
jgi:uncharacterized protein